MYNKTAYISIETTAYSGATMLALLLGAQPDVVTIGEISGLIESDDPDEYLCSCGERIKTCSFWKVVRETMIGKGHDFYFSNFNTKFEFDGSQLLRRFRLGSFRNYWLDTIHDLVLFSLPQEKQRFRKAVARNEALIQAILETSGSRLIVDSSKSRLRVRALRHFSDMDVKVIHLVRRAEGVVYSQLRRNPQADVAALARDWERRHRRLLVNYDRRATDKYYLVRYEDLCEQTEKTLMGILTFLLGKPRIPNMNFQVTDQHVIGNPMRLQPLREIKLDQDWKEQLTRAQQDIINKYTRKLNWRFGYF